MNTSSILFIATSASNPSDLSENISPNESLSSSFFLMFRLCFIFNLLVCAGDFRFRAFRSLFVFFRTEHPGDLSES